ncbi:cathepsin A (carboxypeptidase C) [Tremella mesenterica]|uniref:Carboxypeptidase n=1 Tax=Tremella mesenterica TaxID=5217 RepID=A0A4Q1BMD6_TREME|nr:uncharacterized protein TREMEDRAFT_45442 [Tremella mesenterica DSM 1558]EIW66926.1 hypothetical protein TREMEDRAFT_45442 [Tremella mesenterica DSM 1558]RXK38802.1 cathepsin A (carboxypeptidase C) [Tremella mesenterica]
MRSATALAALSLVVSCIAVPSFLLPASPAGLAAQAIDTAQSWLHGAIQQAKHDWQQIEEGKVEGLKVESVSMEGIEYLSLTHPAFPLHRLRVVEPELCDPTVKQLSGYLDISETKHLFFWFEESRNEPSSDPLVLWLNGGPGCSSTTGLLFELGGCNIANEGKNVTWNEHSWNNVANVLFLDQPVNVGYSYSDDETVNNSPAAAEDVYAFLMLFISKFTEYAEQDFHVAGESYAGTYIPNIGSTIFRHNTALSLAPVPTLPILNLKSLLIGDGVTDPYNQFGTVAEWACYGPYAVYDPAGPECAALPAKIQRCQNLISACYRTNSRFACVPAGIYCYSAIFGDLQDLGLNMYDVRRKCDKSKDADGPLCYREMGWMETYMNEPKNKQELGAPASVTFQSCNMQINQNFLLQGDGMHNSAALLPELIEAGIRVLLYAGEADMLVNSIGCESVLANLETSYAAAYNSAKVNNFTDSDGEVVGWTKAAGDGSGNVAFVSFHNAGHMVPHDDPVGALTMFSKWLKNKPLA